MGIKGKSGGLHVNMRLFGLIAGTIGILCLMVALILGIMIGVNEQPMNKYWDPDEDGEEDDDDDFDMD